MGSLLLSIFIYIYIYIFFFIFIRLLSRSGNGGISSSVDLYCVYIPPKNEYICCHLPICSPNNVPQTHYPLEDGSLVTHATSWNARMQ